MKKIVLIIVMVLPVALWSQNNSFFGDNQNFVFRTGYATFNQHSGHNFQLQYDVSIIPYLNFVVGDIVNNTYRRNSLTLNAGDKSHCFSNTVYLGLGSGFDVFRRIKIGGIAAIGLDVFSATSVNGSLFQAVCLSGVFTVDCTVMITEKFRVGLYGTLQCEKRDASYGESSPLARIFGLEAAVAL